MEPDRSYAVHVGNVLRQARFARDLSIDDAAKKIGISHVTLLRVEKGRTPVQARTLRKIANFFGLDEDAISRPLLQGGEEILVLADQLGVGEGYRTVMRRVAEILREAAEETDPDVYLAASNAGLSREQFDGVLAGVPFDEPTQRGLHSLLANAHRESDTTRANILLAQLLDSEEDLRRRKTTRAPWAVFKNQHGWRQLSDSAPAEDSIGAGGPDKLTTVMEQLLEELPDRQREILMLRIVTGLSVQETAVLMDTTPDEVRVTQHRALGRLRQNLIREGEDEWLREESTEPIQNAPSLDG
ncbi:MAG: helix-turn-helix domain-containing protein [Actinobacteria bacterium]|nr:helix-turn-helix domain-containing protein [Actinomycetota bacterium]